ncbi:MAG: hypothetical protein ACTHU0_33150 [Kofleriaceae bacterium]
MELRRHVVGPRGIIGITVALAACYTAQPTPAAPPESVASNAPADPSTASDAVSCEALAHDPDDPGSTNARALCRRYRDEFLPPVAASAIACLEAAAWSACSVSSCATRALASVPAEIDARCAQVEQQCPGMGAHCAEHISGMNPRGRDRFARCLVDHCGTGLRFCLWDRMVSPCDDSPLPPGPPPPPRATPPTSP